MRDPTLRASFRSWRAPTSLLSTSDDVAHNFSRFEGSDALRLVLRSWQVSLPRITPLRHLNPSPLLTSPPSRLGRLQRLIHTPPLSCGGRGGERPLVSSTPSHPQRCARRTIRSAKG